MILSHRHRFIFFCNGKTGTTSIEQVLEPLQEGAEFNFGCPGLFVPKHVPPALLRGCLPAPIWADYFKFVFVRNPWDWFVSQWRYNQSQWERVPRHRGSWFGLARADRPDVAMRFRKEPGQPITADDVQFLFDYLRQFRGLPGAPGLLQSSYVFDADGARAVDHVGRFETLEQDFAFIAQRIGVGARLPHLNPTTGADYRALFSADGRCRLAELWAADIENFQYRFDPER